MDTQARCICFLPILLLSFLITIIEIVYILFCHSCSKFLTGTPSELQRPPHTLTYSNLTCALLPMLGVMDPKKCSLVMDRHRSVNQKSTSPPAYVLMSLDFATSGFTIVTPIPAAISMIRPEENVCRDGNGIIRQTLPQIDKLTSASVYRPYIRCV